MSAGKEDIIQTQRAQTDYTGGNKSASQSYHEGGNWSTHPQTEAVSSNETGAFTKRIGSTVYRVNVHFSQTSKQTASDKIIRLVKSDAAGKGRSIG